MVKKRLFFRLLIIAIWSLLGGVIGLLAVANLFFYLPGYMCCGDIPGLLLFLFCFISVLSYGTRNLHFSIGDILWCPILSTVILWLFLDRVTTSDHNKYGQVLTHLIFYIFAFVVAVGATIIRSVFIRPSTTQRAGRKERPTGQGGETGSVC